jgi:Cu2+-exporting ATPase
VAGLLVTRSHAVETLARASHFVFDKTGTVTTGEMRVLEVLPLAANSSADDCLALAAALEQASEHPLGSAPLREAAVGRALPAVEGSGNEPGCGVSGRFRRSAPAPRQAGLCQALHGPGDCREAAEAVLASSDTVIALGDEAGWIALFRLGDDVRPEAAAMLAALSARPAGGWCC